MGLHLGDPGPCASRTRHLSFSGREKASAEEGE